MKRENLVMAIKKLTARVTVGASAIRGQGAGVADPARTFLFELDLNRFATSNPSAFMRALNAATDELAEALPPGRDRWGISRKLINIFLRNALYTRMLCDAFGLQQAEHLLEVPLDKQTGEKLNGVEEGHALPQWKSVVALTPETSRLYQAVAKRVALRMDIPRIHLDAIWWGGQ